MPLVGHIGGGNLASMIDSRLRLLCVVCLKRDFCGANWTIHLQVKDRTYNFVVSCVCNFEVLYLNFCLSDPHNIKYWEQAYDIMNSFLLSANSLCVELGKIIYHIH